MTDGPAPSINQPAPRVEVTATWMAECRAKQAAYAAHRRDVAALYYGEPAPSQTSGAPLRGKIHDRRQVAFAL